MRKIILLTILVIVLSACQAQINRLPANSEVKIAIATDLHLLSDQLFDYDPETMEAYVSGDGRLVFYTSEIMDAFSNQLSIEKPDVLIISGDLTHNGEKKSHEVLSTKLKALEREGIRVLVVPGNHDIENFLARSLEDGKWVTTDTIVAKDFERFYKEFGYADAMERDPNG
ncbi:MAG: metallophosphoesterase, partial [Bacilli bacterium]|nr:metallophosphoesterase [Bacilli bacterium]